MTEIESKDYLTQPFLGEHSCVTNWGYGESNETSTASCQWLRLMSQC